MFSQYRNPDLNDQISECLLSTMAAVQAVDVRASFLFMGDLNGHHVDWLGSIPPRTLMVLQPTTSPLYQVVINW